MKDVRKVICNVGEKISPIKLANTSIPLRSETANLLQQNLSGTNAAPLNRLLLEDAYPLELSRIQSMRAGFAVPLVCFVFIALYGLFWKKLEDKDAVA